MDLLPRLLRKEPLPRIGQHGLPEVDAQGLQDLLPPKDAQRLGYPLVNGAVGGVIHRDPIGFFKGEGPTDTFP